MLLFSISAYLKFDNQNLTPLVMLGMILLGGFWVLQGVVSSDDKYKVLNREPLIFDGKYLPELKLTTARLSKKYTPIFITAFIMMMLSVFALTVDIGIFAKDYSQGVPLFIEIALAVLAVSAPSMFYAGTMQESYQLLANNEAHVQGFWFRFWRKTRKKTDELLK